MNVLDPGGRLASRRVLIAVEREIDSEADLAGTDLDDLLAHYERQRSRLRPHFQSSVIALADMLIGGLGGDDARFLGDHAGDEVGGRGGWPSGCNDPSDWP